MITETNLISHLAEINLCPRLLIGSGAVAHLGEHLANAGAKSCFLVTDRGLVRAGIVDRVRHAIKDAPVRIELFAEVDSDPGDTLIAQGAHRYSELQCDSLLAVGGGSSIDMAKAIGAVASNGGSILDYTGVGKLNCPLPYFAALPTLYGSGSEATTSAVITDLRRNFKAVITSPFLIPRVAIIDPELMASVPRHLAGAVMLDALSHAVESYVSRLATPISEALAIKAIELIGRGFKKILADRDNQKSLLDMATAACMAGMAFSQSRLGLVHAIAHPLGAFYHLHHGVTCATMLPPVMAFNGTSAAVKYLHIAKALGSDVNGLAPEQATQLAAHTVADMVGEADIPLHLTDLGVKQEDIPKIVEHAQLSGNVNTNPRSSSTEQLIELLHNCL